MTAAATQAPSPSCDARPDLPPARVVLGRAGTENFPVASRLLPARLRSDLMALYGWARLVDQLGDDYAGDRLAALDEVEGQLRAVLSDQPTSSVDVHPLVGRIGATVRRRGLPAGPLFDLAQANRQDQVVKRYETFEDLVGYCRLSADPVGRMVLAIFGVTSSERVAWSDRICTALQLVEHWQDVAEDAIMGRVYIPQEDLARFGVSDEDLVPPSVARPEPRPGASRWGASVPLRSLLAFECARARRMLYEGSPLIASVGGRLRVAVAGFVAGGLAALDALATLDFDPFADPVRPSPGRTAGYMARLVGRSYVAARSYVGPARGTSA